MSTWFAFLRGINLGNRQMKMAELRECLETQGLADVKTIAASGNVCFSGSGTAPSIKKTLDAAISDRFGFSVEVVLRSGEEMEAIIDNHPFGQLDRKADLTRHVLFSGPDLPEGLALPDRPGDIEILRVDPREIYLAAYRKPNGRYTEGMEEVLKPLYQKAGKGHLDTMRNWNTVEKMLK
ncbi:DUF1697 domain-containing protein [Devosia sp. PTR5]|uniref:DUF1697 domain-containing protein n=1 Tax=Devosia oryzisoli TaxID=2774138 RepID=A0A927FYE9_9HYPH|nr:DUF1697 domain-containing protein [Devosia oryzisoli]MBD8066306.1 DUF1697 domain-containing protein [Devosia oryzisoli]